MGIKERIIVPNRMFLEGIFTTLAATGLSDVPENVVVLIEGMLCDVYAEGFARGQEVRESCKTQRAD